MGAVFARRGIYDAFMQGAPNAIELFHGYIYSGHPVACAAGLASLDVYEREGLFTRAAELATYWEDALHALKGARNVIDLRNLRLMAAVELAPMKDRPTARGCDAFVECFERGALVRYTGDTLALSPPLIVEKSHIEQIFGTIGEELKTME